MTVRPVLRRRLGTGSAVVVGLGAMLGAGVFTVLAPATATAGSLLPVALAVAAIVAFCNATSTADLAAAHPESGGAYVYGRERLGAGWGFLAGWSFVVGKTTSAAAGALVITSYAVPDALPYGVPAELVRPVVAVAVIAVATALNVAGLRWTVGVTAVLVTLTLLALATVVVAGLAVPSADVPGRSPTGAGFGVLTAAGLLFFAFAGYARIATLGEEVVDPARTIPRAVPIALGVTLVAYALVGFATLRALGPDRLATAAAPLTDVLTRTGVSGLGAVTVVGAAVAGGSVLLSVLVGVSRTGLAMARRADLPTGLAVVGRRGTPWRADLVGGTVAAGLALALRDPTVAVGLSAFCVLVYYAVANAAALRLRRSERRWPVVLRWLGLAGCLVLAVTLPPVSAILGAGLVVGGLLLRRIVRRADRESR